MVMDPCRIIMTTKLPVLLYIHVYMNAKDAIITMVVNATAVSSHGLDMPMEANS